MKLLSLFSGIGAFEKGFLNNNIPLEIVNYSEIDKFAIKSYCLMHNMDEKHNLGDITKIDLETLPQVDCITYGFPCQPFSSAGLQQGFNDYLNRGLMFFEALRIIQKVRPKICIAENVKNLKNFSNEFSIMLNELNKLGYHNIVLEINSKNYGSPQNRERVFIISTLSPISPLDLKESQNKLSDVLIPYEKVSQKNYLPLDYYTHKNFNISQLDNVILEDFYSNRPIRIYKDYAPALRASRYGLKVVQKGKLRKLTPQEGFRLMGFTDEDYFKVKNNVSNTQLWKQIGNSIDVLVVTKIISALKQKKELDFLRK